MRLPRVLSYPPRHPYVDRLHGQVADVVHRDELARRPDLGHDPRWLAEHADGIDVAHIHLGHDHRSTEAILAAVDLLEGTGVPIVATVHEIQAPDRPPPADTRLLTAIAPRVQRLITLTPGAAEEIEALVGIRPLLIPHGPVLGTGTMQRARRQRAMFVRTDLPVLLHAGRVNANLDWQSVVEAARRMGGRRRVRILVHQDAEEILRAAGGLTFIDVVLLTGLSQDQLVAELIAAQCLVMPYRWGTHSGLLELASDVGVPVVATAVGYLDQQHPVLQVPLVDGSAEVGRLIRAIEAAPQVARIDVQTRERAFRALVSGHQRVYGALMTNHGLPVPRRQVTVRS